jgi:hypothetical protein
MRHEASALARATVDPLGGEPYPGTGIDRTMQRGDARSAPRLDR